VFRKTAKEAGKPCIPLVPVVSSADGVKLEAKLMRLEQHGELAICREEAFLFAACQEKIWSALRIRSADQEKRIVVAARAASGGPENRVVVARLLQAFYGERTAGDVDGGTDSASENKKVGMTQRQLHRSESPHRNTHDRTVRAAGRDWKPALHVGDEIVHDVVFVAVLRLVDGIRVIRGTCFGHYEKQGGRSKARDVRIVGPIPKSSSAPVQQVEHLQFLSGHQA
jgi:hypothetical protein